MLLIKFNDAMKNDFLTEERKRDGILDLFKMDKWTFGELVDKRHRELIVIIYLFSSFHFSAFFKKLKFNTISKQKILFDHLYQNVGWWCPTEDPYQKKCLAGCWLHQMLPQLEFAKKNIYMSSLERWLFFNRIIK